jgi:hypothetical protein
MNIKSLLIGSTAALVAVSGARAADAIVAAEPEPVEYVRVCDAFGTGFFYIPGTETCLKIDGYVRFRVTATKGTTGYTQNTRARLNFDARSETELGTLRGYIRFQSNSGNAFTGDANVVQDQAMLQLGGLFMGYTESAFAALWGGGVGNFGVIQTDNGGIYSYQQRQQIGYRYDAGAFYAALVLEHDTNPTNNWAPDVVGVLGMTQGWGGADVRVAYDETAKAVGVKGLSKLLLQQPAVRSVSACSTTTRSATHTASVSRAAQLAKPPTGRQLSATPRTSPKPSTRLSVTSTLTASRLPTVVPPRPLTWLKALCRGLRSPTSTFVLKATTAGTPRMLT